MAYIVNARRRRPVVRRARRGLGDTAPKGTVTATSPAIVGLVCDSTGQFTMQNGAWVRVPAGAVCTTLTSSTPGASMPGGTVVTDTVCAKPTGGMVVTIPKYPDAKLVVSDKDGEPFAYKMFCTDPSVVGLTRAQRDLVIDGIRFAPVHHGLIDAFTGNDMVDIGTVVKGYSGWKVGKDAINGVVAPWTFVAPDGDTKNLFVKITGDPTNPTVTFTWTHQDSWFQLIDDGLSSLSPISTDQLCSMLPIASKVPNPYVAAGSIVLQLSGKCPPTCPPGMLYDDKTKTCSCPPGSNYNIATQRCETGGPGADSWLMPAIIGGGVLLALFAITGGGSKRKTKTREGG